MRSVRASLFALGSLCLLSACREAKVESYRVPKEAPPPAPLNMPGMNMANTAVLTADGASLVWDAPANWTAQPASAMRRGSYLIKHTDGTTAELSITAFPGDVGGDLANINRWRNQLQLPPLATADLPAVLQQTDIGDRHFKIVEFDNPQSGQATLAAYTEYEGSTWFFKLTGTTAAIGAEKPAFMDFLKTIRDR